MITYYEHLHLDSVAVGLYGVIVFNALSLLCSPTVVVVGGWAAVGIVKHVSTDLFELRAYFSPVVGSPFFEGAMFAVCALCQSPLNSQTVFFAGFVAHLAETLLASAETETDAEAE
jgi:hypothetical protein